MKKTLPFILLALMLATTTAPADIYVSPTGDDDTGNGTVDEPFATIQKGIDLVPEGGQVVVMPGTYSGTGNTHLDYAGKAITVRSSDPNDPNVVAATIIDSSPSSRAFHFYNGEGPNTVVNGLTIINGGTLEPGGAIRCFGAGPTIRNCRISHNIAFSRGGAIYCYNGSPTITGCSFTDNTCQEWIDQMAFGGAIACEGSSTVTVTNCRFTGNYADKFGGAVYAEDSTVEFSNCLITGNAALSGGGIYSSYSSLNLVNCTFAGNYAYYFGGAIKSYSDGTVGLTNTIVWDNWVDPQGGLGPQIALDTAVLGSEMTVSYSNVQGGQDEVYIASAATGYTLNWDATNISATPRFFDPGIWHDNDTPGDPGDDYWITGDYHLYENSPSVDSGDGGAVAALTYDLEGNSRIIGDAVDMGPYELPVPLPDGPDLTVQLDTTKLLEPLLPGDKVKLPIIVSNLGNQTAQGHVNIDVYVSGDLTLDPNTDIMFVSLADKPVKIAANASKTFTVKLVIPPDATAGFYYFLVHIYSEDIDEIFDDYTSNVAATNLLELVWRFGNVPERPKRAKLTVYDPNETLVTFMLAGPGWGQVQGGPDFTQIDLYETTEKSNFTIKTKPSSAFATIGHIMVADPNGSLNALNAKTTALNGGIHLEGSLNRLLLGHVSDAQIAIGTPQANPNLAVNMTFGRVTDLTIDSQTPIKALTATSWLDPDDDDYISAPWLGKVNIKGDRKTSTPGDFQADLYLTGQNALQNRTLGPVKIAGELSQAQWYITAADPADTKPALNKLNVTGRIADCALNITGHVGPTCAAALNNSQILIGCSAVTGTVDDFDQNHYSLDAQG